MRRKLQAGSLQGIDGKNIMVGGISRRRTGSAITGITKIGDSLPGVGGKPLPIFVAGSFRQTLQGRRKIVDHPMPPSGARRGIGIVNGQGKAFRSGGKMRPVDLGRDILPRASETRKDELVGNCFPL